MRHDITWTPATNRLAEVPLVNAFVRRRQSQRGAGAGSIRIAGPSLGGFVHDDQSVLHRPSIDADRVERLYVTDGWSLRKIADDMGTSTTPIRRVLRERGVAVRRAKNA